jgi:hypothetical protein
LICVRFLSGLEQFSEVESCKIVQNPADLQRTFIGTKETINLGFTFNYDLSWGDRISTIFRKVFEDPCWAQKTSE